MTLSSLLNDFMLLGVFLVLGFAVREVVKPLQKLYIPASVIGGIIALICGEQVLGLVKIPGSFGQISGVFITLIMTAILFGVTMNFKRARNYLDMSILMMCTYGLQIGVGVAVGFGLSKIWTELPYAWGMLGVFSFWGGHGTVAAVGTIFQENGLPEHMGLGMILATISLMAAVLIGMVIVNWGIRKGYAKNMMVGGDSTKQQLCGVLPKENQRSLGSEKVYPSAISSLALQVMLLLVCLFLGNKIVELLTSLWSSLKAIPMMSRGMLGALIVWPIMKKTKLDGYADKRTIDSISAFCLELVVFSAISTLRLDLVTRFFAPLLVFSIVIVCMMVIVALLFTKAFCKQDWFEKATHHYGMGVGTTATGFALLRCVDPELKSSAAESFSMASTFTLPIPALGPVMLPLLVLTSPMGVMGIGFGMAAVCIAMGFIFCYKK